jgi:pimeloyl-ACP methyl ester carboxylesterase
METIASADGTAIAYDRTGSGPPLLRVHGGTSDHTSWHHLLPPFEEHFTVYLIDRRGRGASGDSDTYALEREFEDVAAVVDSIDAPVSLVGHSFGALCSLGAALRTDNLRKLALYEPPLLIDGHQNHETPQELLAEMESLVEEGKNEELLELFLIEVPKITPEELEELRTTPNWAAAVKSAPTNVREFEAVLDYEFDPTQFGGLTIPTLLLSGSESPPFLQAATDALADALPNCRQTVFDGEGHLAMNSAPERYTDEVLGFLCDSN